MFKGKYILMDSYVGMIPYSIELIKLENEGFRIKKSSNGKRVSDDIINVKFTTNVKSVRKQIPKLEMSKEFLEDTLINQEDLLTSSGQRKASRIKNKISLINEKIKSINTQLDIMKSQIDNPNMKEMKRDELRTYLYKNGFTLNGVDYKPYKRSSAKSRKGEMTFIKRTLHKKMINWSRMGLNFNKQNKVDLPSLLAYESLIMSSIAQDDSGLLKIPIDKMLLVSDVKSVFFQKANVVRKSKDTGYLESVPEYTLIESDLFDGESLLDTKYFSNDQSKGMKLLRNHFFKSCAFNTNIQKFMKNMYRGDDYDSWILKDIFGNEIKAKDVEFIFTPSSLKALKFSELVGSENNMYQYWKQKIDQDGSYFGVCKQEKPSQRGYDDNGGVLQQTSYQFINSLPLDKEDIKTIIRHDEKEIYKLKNDINFFIEYIDKNKNIMNTNEMFSDLYRHNHDLLYTDMFKSFRKKNIHSHVEYIKNGKVKIRGDYAVLGGNLYEYLVHSIGELPIDEKGNLSSSYQPLLKENQIYTKLFCDKDELVSWRNPHTSQSNVLVCENKLHSKIRRYFNLSDNIVVVNAINFPIQSILSGADYDSDTMAIVKNDTILKAAKKCYKKYNVSINKVESDKKKFKVNYENMAIIDNDLSKSTLWIGMVVNENQHVLSLYWDRKENGAEKEELDALVEQIDKFTILSEIAIDLAKKKVNIDIDKEINYIRSLVKYKKEDNKTVHPLFFRKIKQNNNIKIKFHKTAMDRLITYLSGIEYADRTETVSIDALLDIKKIESSEVNWNQKGLILEITEEMVREFNKVNSSALQKDEKYRMLDDALDRYQSRISKMKITEETMYSMLSKITTQDNRLRLRLMKILYDYDSEMFKKAFVPGVFVR